MKTSQWVPVLVTSGLVLSPAALPRATASPVATVMRLETEPPARPSEAARATDRCVSLLKAGELEAAGEACNRAVVAAQRDRASAWTAPFAPRATDEEVAVAYNNRAVLNYLTGRLSLAAADATRARSAAPLPGIGGTAAAIQAARRRAAQHAD